jgi:membrane-bound lytic murein transglycosylase D
MTTPKDQSFILNLPIGSRDKYEAAMTAIPLDMRTYWRYHRVEYGDTLPSIARKYHTSPSTIAQANNLADDDVKAGTKLIIPISPGHTTTAAFSRRATHYKVRKGDTVASVADDFEVPVDKLRKWNHLRGDALTAGRTLVIYKPAESDSAESEPKTASASGSEGHSKVESKSSQTPKYHKVMKGETLSGIAETNHTSVAALKRDNPKLSANLRAGDVLLIKK